MGIGISDRTKSVLESMTANELEDLTFAIEEIAQRHGLRDFAKSGSETSISAEDRMLINSKADANDTQALLDLKADADDVATALGLKEDVLTKGNLTAGSTKVTIGGTGTGAVIGAGVSVDVAQGNLDHGSIGGLSDDDHTQYIRHNLATAVNDFLVGAGTSTFTFVKKTLAEVKTILGLGSAAYTSSGDYAVSAKGVTNGDSHDHNGGDGAQVDHGGLGGLADDDHSQYLLAGGSRALSADWDIGNGRMIEADEIRARDADGLALYEDGGSGIFVKDGGDVAIGTTTSNGRLTITGNDANTSVGSNANARAWFNNANTTVNTWFPIWFSCGSISSGAYGGIAGQVTNVAGAYGAFAIVTRGADGFLTRMYIDTGVKIVGNVGFYNTAPVAQHAAIANATDAASAITQLNLALAALRALGLIAT